jgi:hypothetical protein
MPFLTTIGGGSARGFGRGRLKLGLGSSAANPAINADAILAENPSAPDGVYYFKDPSGSNSVYSTYCIMQKYGGGWMKAVQYYDNTAVGTTAGAINPGGAWTTAEINNGAGKLQNADLNRITGTECLMRVSGGTDNLFNSGAGTGKLTYNTTLPSWGSDSDPNDHGYTLQLDNTSNGILNYDVVYLPDSRGRCNHTTSYWISDHNYFHTSQGGFTPPYTSYSQCWTFGSNAVYTNLHWMSGQAGDSGGSIAWGNNTSSSFAIFLRPTRNPGYTTRGIIMDWDPAKLNLGSDLTTISNGTSLTAGLSEYSQRGINIRVNGGAFHWRTAEGGHIDSSSGNTGRISVDGALMEKALDGCKSMTLTCWFQSNGGGRQVLLSRYGTGYNNQFNHIVDPSGDFHSNSTGVIGGSSQNYDFNAWSNNTWHLCHWVYNVSDGIARWYIDGSQVGTSNWGTDSGAGLTGSSTAGFGIMSRADDYERLVGRMGRARVHGCALTAAEIAAEWTNERSIYGR